MRLSTELKIGLKFGLFVSLALSLVPTSDAPWRIATLVLMWACALSVVQDSDWTSRRKETLTLLNDGVDVTEEPSVARSIGIRVAVTVVMLAFGFLTWPPLGNAVPSEY